MGRVACAIPTGEAIALDGDARAVHKGREVGVHRVDVCIRTRSLRDNNGIGLGVLPEVVGLPVTVKSMCCCVRGTLLEPQKDNTVLECVGVVVVAVGCKLEE